jgi:alpha-L-fucosidase
MLDWNESTRRSFLKQFGAAGALALSAAGAHGLAQSKDAPKPAPTAADLKQAATREARMAWWHQAKFGMFIHWGLYSLIGQQEWAKEVEGVPFSQSLLSKTSRRVE